MRETPIGIKINRQNKHGADIATSLKEGPWGSGYFSLVAATGDHKCDS